MNPEDVLRASVVKNETDESWLMYADCLEDMGDPLGHYIKLRIETKGMEKKFDVKARWTNIETDIYLKKRADKGIPSPAELRQSAMSGSGVFMPSFEAVMRDDEATPSYIDKWLSAIFGTTQNSQERPKPSG